MENPIAHGKKRQISKYMKMDITKVVRTEK